MHASLLDKYRFESTVETHKGVTKDPQIVLILSLDFQSGADTLKVVVELERSRKSTQYPSTCTAVYYQLHFCQSASIGSQ